MIVEFKMVEVEGQPYCTACVYCSNFNSILILKAICQQLRWASCPYIDAQSVIVYYVLGPLATLIIRRETKATTSTLTFVFILYTLT